MTYNAADALRAAGILGGEMSPELEEFYASLPQEEAEVLISVKSRLETILPDVVAHSYTRPESSDEQGIEASMLCACGVWTGGGGTSY